MAWEEVTLSIGDSGSWEEVKPEPVKTKEPTGFFKSIAKGFTEDSATGLAYKSLTGGKYTPQKESDFFIDKAGHFIGTVTGDIPTLTAGSIGGALAGGPAAFFTSPAAGMGLTELTKAHLRSQLGSGESPEDVGMAGLKGAALGTVMGPLSKIGTVAPRFAKATFPLEVAGTATVASGMEGKTPTLEDVALFTIPVLGMKGAQKLGQVGRSAVYSKPEAELFKIRQAAAEKAGIPATATTGKPVQSSLAPTPLDTAKAGAGSSIVDKRRRRNIVNDLEDKHKDLKNFQEMLVKKQESEAQRLIIDEELPAAARLDEVQRKTIEDRVNALGSVEKVREVYSGDDNVSIYARELAANKFRTEATKVNAEAKPETPSVQKLNKGALTAEEFKALEDTNVFTVEELERIKKLPGFKQREQYNRTFNIVPEVKHTSAEIEKARELASKVEAAAKARYNTLGGTNKLNPSKKQVSAMGEIEQELAALRKEMEGITPDKVTPELEAKMVALAEKVGNELPFGELLEPTERLRKFLEVNEEGEPILTFEDYMSRKDLIRQRLDAYYEKTGKQKKSLYRRRVPLKEAVEEIDAEHIPGEDLSPITEIGTKPSRTRAQEINKEREGRSGSAEEWEAKLEAEGMPAELNFDYAKKESVGEALGRIIFEQLTKDSEPARAKVEGDIDRLIARRRTIISKTKERNTLVTASKYIPLDLENAKVWFEKLSKYDSLVDTTITHKQSAYTRKAISKAVADKVITPEEARFMNVVFSTLKKQPTFDLEIDKTGLPDKTSGLYCLADNLIKIKDPKYTAHEVAHWAFYNLLSSADRKTYYNHFMETYYRPDGKLDVIKLRRSTTDPRNAVTSPGEAFAAKMSDFMFDKVITPAEKSLFMKVTEWFNTLVNKLRKRTNTDYTGVEDIFKKVLETEGERHDWKEVSIIAPEGSTRTMGSPYNARLVKQGSSKIFDKFLDAFIGTGEGGALRGWGHYFTDSEGLARHYAKVAASRGPKGTKLIVDGKDYDISKAYIPQSNLNSLMYSASKNYKDSMLIELSRHAEHLRKQFEAIRNREATSQETLDKRDKDLVSYLNALGEVDKIITDLENAKSVTVERPKKVIHHVEIPDDVRLLDLDKPIPKDIAEILSKALDKAFYQDKLPYEVKDQYGRVKNGVRIIQDDLKSIDNKTTEYGVLVKDLEDPFTGEVLAKKGELITRQMQDSFNSNNGIERIKMKPVNKEKADKWLTSAYAVKDALENRPDSVTYETLKRNLLKEFKLDEKDFDAWAEGKSSYFDIVTKNVEPEYFLTKKPFTGEDLQQSLWSLFSNQNNITKQEAKKLTSAFLRDEVGLQGNTFVGEGSGKQNYVIFDENVPKIKSSVTFDMLGFQQMYERITELGKTFKKAKMDDKGRRILGEIKGNDWGLAEAYSDQTILRADTATVKERIYRNLGPYVVSPVHFVKGTINERHVYNANLAEMYTGSMYDQHRTTIDNILLNLKNNSGDPKNIRKVIEKKIEGTDAEKQAASEVRQWLDGMKERYKVFMLNEYKENLSKKEYDVLIDIISGRSIDDVKAKNPKLDTKTLESIYAKYKEIDTWGLDNYIPNVEAGRFKVVVKATNVEGKNYKKLVAIGLSEKDAIRKATRYAEEHPEIHELEIDTDFKVSTDNITPITRKQYYAMMHSLAKKMEESIDGIDKGVAKNMAQATMKRKFKIKPTDSYSPFLEPRKDILLGEEDIFPVLKSYAYSLEKKMALDPVIEAIRGDLGKMNKWERDYILDYIEDVKGRYGTLDKVVDDLMEGVSSTRVAKALGIDVSAYRGYSRAISGARTLEANLKLGYRPVAAGVNFASGQLHTWVKRGLPMYMEGIKFLNTSEGRKLIQDIEPFLGTNIVDTGISITSKTPVWKPLGMFQKVEPYNREVSAAVAYVQAIKEGMTPEAAKMFAIRSNWAEQFTYNIANLPKIMRGPTGKLLTQFKPYLIKEIEFMKSLSAPEWARYFGMQLILGGPRAYMLTLKTLPILAGFAFWDDLEEWMNKEYPLLSRGAGGAPGLINKDYAFDMSAAASFQFPTSTKDIAGPFISDLLGIKKNVIDPMFAFGPYSEDYQKTGNVAPILKHWLRLMKFTFAEGPNKNMLKDEDGNELYEVKDIIPLYLQSMAGVESLDLNMIRAEERILANRDERIGGHKTRIANEVAQVILNKKPITNDMRDMIKKYGVTSQTIINRANKTKMTPRQRAIYNTEVRRRMEVMEMFPIDDPVSEPVSQDYGLSE